jgi:hypothetical protein
MWWADQNMAKTIKTGDGRSWHFRVWYGMIEDAYVQRIYFWDESKQETGCAEFAGDRSLDTKQIKNRIQKLAKTLSYRQRFHRELAFPVERYYS